MLPAPSMAMPDGKFIPFAPRYVPQTTPDPVGFSLNTNPLSTSVVGGDTCGAPDVVFKLVARVEPVT